MEDLTGQADKSFPRATRLRTGKLRRGKPCPRKNCMPYGQQYQSSHMINVATELNLPHKVNRGHIFLIAKRLTIFVRPERKRVGRTKVSVGLCGSVANEKAYHS